jgi:DNA repair protein RadC
MDRLELNTLIMQAVLPAAAEVKLVYINKQKASERAVITCSSDAHKEILKGFNPDTIALQEEFVCIYTNRANQVLGIYKVATGGQTGVVADPRMIISVALKIAGVGLLVAHNHPSGNLRPSRADEELTFKIKEAAKFFDLKLLDHLIVEPSGEQYFSFADEGLV